MRFFSRTEAEDWISARGLTLPEGRPQSAVDYPGKFEHSLKLAEFIVWRFSEDSILLLLEEWGIWRENEHLYYKLRQSYGDHQLLHEAPGHLFLSYERWDLVSFLQVALINGWGGYILSQGCDVGFFFSHDSWIGVWGKDDDTVRNHSRELQAFVGQLTTI